MTEYITLKEARALGISEHQLRVFLNNGKVATKSANSSTSAKLYNRADVLRAIETTERRRANYKLRNVLDPCKIKGDNGAALWDTMKRLILKRRGINERFI